MEPLGGTTTSTGETTTPSSSPRPPGRSENESRPAQQAKSQTLPFTRSPAKLPSLFQYLPDELSERLVLDGHPRYRARQILNWVYRKRTRDPSKMTDLSPDLRKNLGGIVALGLPQPEEIRTSEREGAIKFVLALGDGQRVESVAMQSRRGVTLCISSQVGCGMSCVFCATGTMGLARNLKPDEIVAQVLLMLEHASWEDPGFNLVFMGMGEPLANYASVLKAIRILNHQETLGVGARRITVSTVGLVPQMRRLALEGMQVGLALSLHATTDELRNRLVPLNQRYSLAEILEAARYYTDQVGRRVTLEYVLLAGVNDSRNDALRLGEIARSLPSKVNLIPYNPVPQLPWQRPDDARIKRFVDLLMPRAPSVTVRRSQGKDVWAACGQLGARRAKTPSR